MNDLQDETLKPYAESSQMASRFDLVADYDSLNDVVIDDVAESVPTSAMLNFCKKRFLLPFVNILGVAGLRPMTVDATNLNTLLGHVQSLIVFTLLLIGYILQYITSFRRDRGLNTAYVFLITFDKNQSNLTNTTLSLLNNSYDSNQPHSYYSTMPNGLHNRSALLIGETIFVFVVPSVLHLSGFVTALYAFRVVDNEHLQNLVERVFILAYRPYRLLFKLWLYIAGGLMWLLLMTVCIVVHELNANENVIQLKWFNAPSQNTVKWTKIMLLSAICIQDLVQVVIIITYAIQCHLLRCYLDNLRNKLLQNTIDPLDWMREMSEFRKLLHHLNSRIATPLCWLTLLNLIYTLSSTIHSSNRTSTWTDATMNVFGLNVINISLWLVIGLFPFFQAASLTLTCQRAQTCGHQIRIRPFVHHNTSAEDLNSVLLYSSSLRMSAKLFRMPIQGNYLFFIILCLVIVILTLGMSLNFSLGLA